MSLIHNPNSMGLGRRREFFRLSPWALWDETDEAGWGDSANTFIVFMDELNAGDNEIGQGAGLSEANRTLTEFGELPGATGSPLTRAFDTECMTMTQACAEVTKSSTWCIVFKLLDFTEDEEGTFLKLSEGDNDFILMLTNNARRIQIRVDAGDSDYTSSAAPVSDVVYVAAQADGVNDVICGWSTSKITKWADIPSAQKATIAGVKGDLSGETYYGSQHYICAYYGTTSNPAYNVTTKIQYIVISKTAFIKA